MAAATHVLTPPAMTGPSAEARPPAPRCAVPSAEKLTGPRLLATTMCPVIHRSIHRATPCTLPAPMTQPLAQRCYRHPYTETYVRCTRCSRPICPDCMVPASVGHQCPECVREGRKLQPEVKVASGTPYVTYALIGGCVAMILLTQGTPNSA